MKKILILMAFIVSYTISSGQTNYEDVIFLKNGGIMRGMIIENIPNVSVKLQTNDRNVFVYNYDEIIKFTREPSKKINKTTKSYYGIFESGFAFGIKNQSMYKSLNFDLINGIKIDSCFDIGLNIGYSFLVNVNQISISTGDKYIPVMLDLGYRLQRKRFISPYFVFDFGYNIDPNEGKNSLIINPSAGILIYLNNLFQLNFGIGYEWQKINYSIIDPWATYNFPNSSLKMLSVNLGLSFK